MKMLSIIYQDEHLIVVDKPPGISVHRQSRFPHETPVLQLLRDQVGHRVWPVHRLDRQTSGCLMFTRRQEILNEYSQALHQGIKIYWAFVRGHFPDLEEVTVTTPIKVNGRQKKAKSIVRCLGRSTSPRCSLLEVQPKTGRNHQVRRHVRDLHHPILHDGDHGDSRVNRHWRETTGLNRLALHACTIQLSIHGIDHRFESPLPQDLFAVFQKMPWWSETVRQVPLLVGHHSAQFANRTRTNQTDE